MRYNIELYQLYKLPDIIGLRWAGHIHSMSDAELSRGIMQRKRERRRVLDDLNYDGWMVW